MFIYLYFYIEQLHHPLAILVPKLFATKYFLHIIKCIYIKANGTSYTQLIRQSAIMWIFIGTELL